MEEFPSSPPQTIIVIDAHPHNVSFIRAVLDAHALPYTVQVIDPGDHARDVVLHLARQAFLRASTGMQRDRGLPQRDRTPRGWCRTVLWPAWMRQRISTRWTPRGHRWSRGLAWGAGLGLLVGLVWSAPWLWLWSQPRGSIRPPPPSDHAPAGHVTVAAPAPSAAAEARSSAQRYTLAYHASVTDAMRGDTPSGGPLRRSPASVAQHAVHLRPSAAAPSHAARAGHPRHARRHDATLRPAPRQHLVRAKDETGKSTRPRDVERARVVGAHRPGEWSVVLPAPPHLGSWGAPDPAPEMERPWNRGIVNDTGV